MNKRIQKSQISIGLLMMCVIAMPALLFSSCKKNAYYTVTFNSQGGSAVSPITGVKQGSTITLPASPTKAGFTFTFGGWCTDKEGKSSFSPTTPINSDLTLYAKWIEQFYTVTFDSQGGSDVKTITRVKYGSTITLPPEPIKANSTFDGWFTDKEASTDLFSAKTPITADLTLYAKWNVFTLSSASFPNGGKIPPKHFHQSSTSDRTNLNVSPQLSWDNAPKGTTSFLIIMEYAVRTKFAYGDWAVYNIPADRYSLTENDPWLEQEEYDFIDRHSVGHYRGPDPYSFSKDDGKHHTIQIMIFALDLPVDYLTYRNHPKSEREARKKLGAHILQTAYIRGTFDSNEVDSK